MKIEIWSDYVCPFCYIGEQQLQQAIKDTNLGEHVEIELKGYMLDPNTPKDSTTSVYDSLAQKYQMSPEQSKKMTEGVIARAKEVGLNYDFSNLKEENTLNAHRLAKWAEKQGKGYPLSEAIWNGHFEHGERIGQDEVLLDLAEGVGLSREEAAKVLASDEFTNEVQEDINQARQIGVQGVPFFVINNKYAISGAQSGEVFEDALKKVAEEEGIKPGLQMMGNGDSGVCKDGKCEL